MWDVPIYITQVVFNDLICMIKWMKVAWHRIATWTHLIPTYTKWDPRVTIWFTKPINYSYVPHKPTK